MKFPIPIANQITLRIDKPCVYRHWLGEEIIYIGKGRGTRPFEVRDYSRKTPWRKALKGSDTIRVEIVRWFDTDDAALRFEKREIARFNPAGNTQHVLIRGGQAPVELEDQHVTGPEAPERALQP